MHKPTAAGRDSEACQRPVTLLGLNPDGTSVILGHVDGYAGVSVFFRLDLRQADRITVVRADGSTAVFSVDGVQRVAKTAFPSTAVYGTPATRRRGW